MSQIARSQQRLPNATFVHADMTRFECAPDSDEILVQLEELQAVPGRERALIDTLRRRGKLASDDQREELFRRAKRLADAGHMSAVAQEILRDLLRLERDLLRRELEAAHLREQAAL